MDERPLAEDGMERRFSPPSPESGMEPDSPEAVAEEEWEARRAGYERGRRDSLAVRAGCWPPYRSAWIAGYVSGYTSVSGDGGEGDGDG